MSDIYLTIGTTSCGKSTWARYMAVEYSWYIVSGDNLRSMTYGRYEYRKDEEPALRSIALDLAVRWWYDGANVIVDDAAWFLKRLDRSTVETCLIQAGVPLDKIKWVVFPFPSREQVLDRRKDDTRGYDLELWGKVFDDHERKADYPVNYSERIIEPPHFFEAITMSKVVINRIMKKEN